ncbi:MAG: CBS domain-containing protein [Desulfotalea sp.]
MDNDNIQNEKKGILKKIMSLLPFGPPETTEDLEMEIQELLEEGEEQGLISPLEEKMINSIFDFRETKAAEIMTPVAEIISCSETSPIDEIVGCVLEHGYTRIPIYQDNPDRVIGLIHVKDLLQMVTSEDRKQCLADYLHSVTFVSEDQLIGKLLPQFQAAKAHMAMVTDEFGAIRGLITLEDVLEEIVGEIDDEYDYEQDTFEEKKDGSILAHGRVDIEKIEEHFQKELPDGPYESLGGLLIHLLGKLGKVGDIAECNELRFEIKSASNRHIKTVQVSDISLEQQ